MVLHDKVNTREEKDIENFEYAAVEPEDQWKVNMVLEIIEARESQVSIENFEKEELEEILEHLCKIVSFLIFIPSCSFLGDLPFCKKILELSKYCS